MAITNSFMCKLSASYRAGIYVVRAGQKAFAFSCCYSKVKHSEAGQHPAQAGKLIIIAYYDLIHNLSLFLINLLYTFLKEINQYRIHRLSLIKFPFQIY
jgi:hypothetical protein